MNEEQHAAVVKVKENEECVRDVGRQLMDAKRKLKRAEGDLKSAIRRDPGAWNTVGAVQDS